MLFPKFQNDRYYFEQQNHNFITFLFICFWRDGGVQCMQKEYVLYAHVSDEKKWMTLEAGALSVNRIIDLQLLYLNCLF